MDGTDWPVGALHAGSAAASDGAAPFPLGGGGGAGGKAANRHQHPDLPLHRRPGGHGHGRQDQPAAPYAPERAPAAAKRRQCAEGGGDQRLPRPAHAADGNLWLSGSAGAGATLSAGQAVSGGHPGADGRHAHDDGGAVPLLRRHRRHRRAEPGTGLPEPRSGAESGRFLQRAVRPRYHAGDPADGDGCCAGAGHRRAAADL